jgi:hypothetical protein
VVGGLLHAVGGGAGAGDGAGGTVHGAAGVRRFVRGCCCAEVVVECEAGDMGAGQRL